MAEEKGYGSGKSRSAANSSMRRRVAAGQTPKSVKGAAATIKAGRAKMAASPLGQLADTLLGFALPVGKLKAAKSNVYKATSFGKTNPMIGSYKGSLPKLKPMDIYNDVTNTNFTIPIGLGLVAAAGAAGTKGLNERRKRDAIKKASVKTRKGQSRGR